MEKHVQCKFFYCAKCKSFNNFNFPKSFTIFFLTKSEKIDLCDHLGSEYNSQAQSSIIPYPHCLCTFLDVRT